MIEPTKKERVVVEFTSGFFIGIVIAILIVIFYLNPKNKMERLTKINEYGAIEPTYALKSLEEDNDWSAECREKLAYYEDLEERIYSIFEDITIEMIVGEIESEHNKSIETILSLCKKLKEMTK